MARMSGRSKSEVEDTIDKFIGIGEAIENPEDEIPKLFEKFGYTNADIDAAKEKISPILNSSAAKGVMRMFNADENKIEAGIEGIKRRNSKSKRAEPQRSNGSNGGLNREQRRAAGKTSRPDLSKYV